MKKVLIANRGEIAVRIARGCRVLGIDAVAIFSDADRLARHVRLADEAVRVGPAPSAQSYLDIPAILAAARLCGADAVHPGYGFLSENVDFAQAVEAAGLTWIGPPAQVIAPIQSKTAAKAVAQAAGVPTAPAAIVEDFEPATLQRLAREIGFPMLVKPQDGGGGKGMQKVLHLDELLPALLTAKRIASSAFKSDRLFVERYVENARHVEVQVLGDRHGQVVHCFERDCSVQRRHQKVIEESPCPVLSDAERAAICESGRAFAAQVGYQGAGTVEFLFDPVARRHYFLEMNTRLQVEHPVTEVVVGVDLVLAQLRIARGERLSDILRGSVVQRGHAIEVRVYAEDPAAGYVPQAGRVLRADWPDVPFVRTDAGFSAGDEVSIHYDPMLAKIIAWGRDRDEAADRMKAALRETVIHGVVTNLPMLAALMDQPQFRSSDVHTGWLDATWGSSAPGQGDDLSATAAAMLAVAGPAGPLAGSAARSATAGSSPVLPDVWQSLPGFRMGGGGES